MQIKEGTMNATKYEAIRNQNAHNC